MNLETFREIRRVLWITMFLNLAATAAKLAVGYATGSLALIADGFDSLFDASSNVVGLVGVRVASHPADERHPYGHRKAETMTALVISLLLFMTAWELVKSAIERLRDPSLIRAEVNVWSFGAAMASIAVHVIVVWYELREGRRLRSDVLVADALHTRADILVTISVIVGLIAVRMGYPLADPIMALIVSLVIAKIGVDIIRESVPTLMDSATLSADEITGIALGVPGVDSVHRVRSRGHEAAVYADLHIRVDPAMSTEQAHAIAHEVQARLRERRSDIQDVTVHVEPAGAASAGTSGTDIATLLRRLADGMGLGVHEVWAYTVEGRYHAEVHLEADGALSLREAHNLASQLEKRAHDTIPALADLTVHIEPEGQTTEGLEVGLPEEVLAKTVKETVDKVMDTDTCHRIRAWRGKTGWTVSFHCRLDGGMSLEDAHRASMALEAHLRQEIAGLERVVVHTEPRDE